MTEHIYDHELAIEKYEVVRTNSHSSRTGGVLTYIKKNIKYKVVENSNTAIDGFWFNAIQIDSFKNIILCNIYRSPKSSIKKFIDKIVKFSDKWVETKKVILLGDFNIDMTKNNKYCNFRYAKQLKDKLFNIGLKQYINQVTRSTLRSETIIDLVFSNFKLMTKVLVLPKISDDNIIVINIEKLEEIDNMDAVVFTRN